MHFKKNLEESNSKSSKMCVDKGSEFYNRLINFRILQWIHG